MSFDYQRDTVVTRAAAMVDEGLRQYMLKVYNYMALGLLVTAFVSYGLAHSTLAALFFNVQAGTLSGLGWVAVLLPFVLVFMMGSAVSQSADVVRCFFRRVRRVDDDGFLGVYGAEHSARVPDYRGHVFKHEPVRLYDQTRFDQVRIVSDDGAFRHYHCDGGQHLCQKCAAGFRRVRSGRLDFHGIDRF